MIRLVLLGGGHAHLQVLRSPARHRWALRLARLDEAFPPTGPIRGAERRIIAFLTESGDGRAILEPIGEPAMPPRIAQRGPPEWYEAPGMPRHGEEDPAMPGDPLAQLEPEYDYDPRETGWRPAEGLRDRSLPPVRKPPPPLPLPTAKTVSNTPRKTGFGSPITLLCSAGA